MNTPVAPAGFRPVPAGHPAQALLSPGSSGSRGRTHRIEMVVSGGARISPDAKIRAWAVDFLLVSSEGVHERVGEASVYTVTTDGVVEDDVANHDHLAVFADPFFAPDGLASTHPGTWLLVDTFELEPAWRGTNLTPLLMVHVLEVFADLGVVAAGLMAAPIVEDGLLGKMEHRRIKAKIAARWKQVGFRPVQPGDAVMWQALAGLDATEGLEQRAAVLVGADPVLQAARAS